MLSKLVIKTEMHIIKRQPIKSTYLLLLPELLSCCSYFCNNLTKVSSQGLLQHILKLENANLME